MLLSVDSAVNGQVQGYEEAVGVVVRHDLHSVEVPVVAEHHHLLSDEGYRGLVEPAGQGDGAVHGHPSLGPYAKVVLQVGRRGANALHIFGKSLEWWLPGAVVLALVILFAEPSLQSLIDLGRV